MTHPIFTRILAASLFLCIGASNATESDPIFEILLKDHRFEPSELNVPTGIKFKLVISNKDKEPEEFDSDDLRREKLVPPGKQAIILLGPLKPGVYKFSGEYHSKTAQGKITAK